MLNILDIGAAGGVDPLLNKKKHIKKKFYLFEPSSKEFQKLKKKYLDNNNIKLFRIALSNKKYDKKLFYLFGTSSSLIFSEFLEQKREKVTRDYVSVDSIDSLRKKKIIPQIDIIKIDTEGSEINILEGGKNCFKNEVLAVKIEFKFHSVKGSNDFNSIHNFMMKNEFLLAGMSYSYTDKLIMNSGDLLYLKNSKSKIFNKKINIEKCVKICELLKKEKYLLNFDRFSHSKTYNKRNIFDEVYLPLVGSLFFKLSLFFFGKRKRLKSAPKNNRI